MTYVRKTIKVGDVNDLQPHDFIGKMEITSIEPRGFNVWLPELNAQILPLSDTEVRQRLTKTGFKVRRLYRGDTQP